MGFFSEKKPYTAISSTCEQLLEVGSNNDPATLVNLIELIQGSSPTSSGGQEAGRLLRKRIKHGSPGEQVRAVQLVEVLVDNGIKTGPLVTDSGLGDALVHLAQSPSEVGDRATKASRTARTLLKDWSTRRGSGISGLYARTGLSEKQTKHRHKSSFSPDDDLDDEVFGENGELDPPRHQPHSHVSASGARSGARRAYDSEPDDEDTATRGRGSGTSGNRVSRSPSPVNLRGASLATTIATAHNIATRLTNALIASPRGSRETKSYYLQAKQLRHRLIKLVHDPSADVQSYIGQLLAANEELVTALQAHDAVVRDGERLQMQNDHESIDLLGLDSPKPSPVRPIRPPPMASPPDEHSDDSSDDGLQDPGDSIADDDDPFGDGFEQSERPKHTPLW